MKDRTPIEEEAIRLHIEALPKPLKWWARVRGTGRYVDQTNAYYNILERALISSLPTPDERRNRKQKP